MGIRMSDIDIDTAPRPASPHTKVSGRTAQRQAAQAAKAAQAAQAAGGTQARQAPAAKLAPPAAPRRPQRAPGRARPQPARPARTVAAAPFRAATTGHRMPFVVLLCGLLGGTLLSLLVISTTLAAGSFRITNLQSQVTQLSRQREHLQEQVATARSAQVIGERAYGLGMRPPGELRFIDLKTGRVRTDAGTGAVANINVPGFTP